MDASLDSVYTVFMSACIYRERVTQLDLSEDNS